MKEKAYITSLTRINKYTPWSVGLFENGKYYSITVGDKGKTATSPRFHIFLQEIEKKVKRYPVEIGFYHLAENRDMEITKIRNQVVYADCGFDLNRAVPKARYSYQSEVMGSPLRVAIHADSQTSARESISGGIASTSMDYVAVGQVSSVDDGDTINVKLKSLSTFLEKYFKVDETITVRFLGVDTPEKRDDEANAYKDGENTKTGKMFGVTMDDMYSVADEATKFTKKTLNWKKDDKPYVILHFDRAEEGHAPITDDYGRYLTEVYATAEKNPDNIRTNVESGKSYVNACKSLLVTFSEDFPKIPLGIFSFKYSYSSSSILNPFSWIEELGIKKYDTGTDIIVDDFLDEDLTPDSADVEEDVLHESNLNTDTLNFGQQLGPNSNNLDFFTGYDDRLGEFTAGIKTVEDLKRHSRIRIGDCILTIPPIAIEVNKTSNISKIKTLRTKSSVMVNRGQTLTTLTLDLYFHNLENINGIKYPWKPDMPKGKEKYFYVDGLRPLLAQFAKAPFLPICNYYINDTLGIQDVALLDIEVSTVPNFPESLQATLTLMEFNSECYTMGIGGLYESVNFPMLRWYYNQAMENPDGNYKHRFFKGVDGLLTNDISFTIAKESYLDQRKQAVEYIRKADSPEKVRIELKTKNVSYQNKKEDSDYVKYALKSYKHYKDEIKAGERTIISMSPTGSTIKDALMEEFSISEDDAKDIIAEGKEHFQAMYPGMTASQWDVKAPNQGFFVPYEAPCYYDMRFEMSGRWYGGDWSSDKYDNFPQRPVSYDEDPYKGTEKQGLFWIKEMKDPANQKLMEDAFGDYYHEKKGMFYIPGTKDAYNKLKEIKNSASDMLEAVDDYEREFNSMLAIVEASESSIPMEKYEIEGTFIPISVKANYSNEFASVPVQSGSAPALQFIGGGDAYLDMVFEVDEEGAKSINNLVDRSDYFARTYSLGITNGFIGVENQMAALFGIQYIMIESLTINTVPNYPGRFQVFMRATSFDKTQRQREELTALPGNSEHMDTELLKANRNAFANDRMIESRLHTLDPYPDLELPTYKELNAALPLMDAGGCTEYKNITGGTYVDPDFYFSTVSTLRKDIEAEYGGMHQLNLYDSTGVAVYTSNKDTTHLFHTTEADYEAMKELEEQTEPIGWVFDWGGEDKPSEGEEVPSTAGGITSADAAGSASYANEEVKAFLEERDENNKPKYATFPSRDEFKRLFPESYESTYLSRSENPGGDETLIYQALDSFVNTYFKDYFVCPDFVETSKGDMENANKHQKNVSYAPPAEFYKMVANYRYDKYKSSDDQTKYKKIKSQVDDGKITIPAKSEVVTKKNYSKVGNKPTKERFMTLFKAFLDKMSNWSHYRDNMPLVSNNGRVGLAQVDVTGEDMTVDEVKRLMYDWKYNLEVAFTELAAHYEDVKTLDENTANFEACVRPWDAMFAKYEKKDADIKTAADVESSNFAGGIMARFTHYATKPFNTFSGFNKGVYKYAAGLEWDEFVAIDGSVNPDEVIDKLVDLEYYDLKVLKANNLTVESDKEAIKKVMRKYLQEKSATWLEDTYQSHLKKLYEIHKKDWNTLGEKDDNGYDYDYEILVRGMRLYESIAELNDVAIDSTGEVDTRLYNDVDPQMIFTEMFHDLRYHDQRGRMIRAFPTFQMFIIHEGDYFGKYKFWDNMYGFNAIESIDIYRSRKIAADTAQITMTNVYSNLTTRRTDVDYVDRQLKWWDNYIWNEIPQDLIDKKENEIHKNIYLEPGARIHLRMGYSGNAADLPVVFNGTITEMDIGEVIDIVAQGDGIELGNVISGDPDDDNNGMFVVTEPRDMICKFLASKGSWLKDFFNNVSEGRLFENNPLGIMHFGQAWDTENTFDGRPLGKIRWFNDEYGEVAQNIYSSNGTPTYSQWMHPNGERNNIFSDFTWSNMFKDGKFNWKIFNPGDEDNVVVSFYNQTVWDIIQTVTYCSPDYIAAVHPFELRSTLFFGKPYWRCAFEYSSTYHFDEMQKTWVRHLQAETRRPYMQQKLYFSGFDIIENNIRATEDTLFTNCIVNYDGNQTPVLYADADIRYDKHKTRVIEANIVAQWADFYKSEVMASFYGCSALRDSMKDMYKGNILVLGDPTVKPHDMMYIGDEVNDMQGNTLVKAVTHHFSRETGFVSSIEPDLVVMNDDAVIMSLAEWGVSFGTKVAASALVQYAAGKGVKNVVKWATNPEKMPKKVAKWVSTKSIAAAIDTVADDSDELKAIQKSMQEAIKAGDADKADKLRGDLAKKLNDIADAIENDDKLSVKTKNVTKKGVLKAASVALSGMDDAVKNGKLVKSVVGVVRGATSFHPVGFIVNAGIWVGCEILFEKFRRYRENLQVVQCMPLTYRGKELVAGITNHNGMVYGDAPGRYDKLMNAQFGQDDGEIEKVFGNTMIELINFATGGAEDLTDTENASDSSGFFYVDKFKEAQLNALAQENQ